MNTNRLQSVPPIDESVRIGLNGEKASEEGPDTPGAEGVLELAYPQGGQEQESYLNTVFHPS